MRSNSRRGTEVRASLTALLVGALGAGAACADGAAPERERYDTEPIPAAVREGGAPSADSLGGTRLVITDEAAWRAFWTAHHAGMTPAPEVPAVDFEREHVLVAVSEVRPTGGYTIAFGEPEVRAGRLEVPVVQTEPGRGCIVTTALEQPVVVARIASDHPEVVFTESTTVHHCE